MKLSLIKRALSLCAAVALLAGCATTITPQKPLTARLIGHATLPHKMSFQGTVVGGLSGIDYDAATDTFYILSDDRSDHGAARFYTAKIDYDAQALRAVTLTAAIALKQADGSPFPSKAQGGEVPDPEAIRFRPDTRTLLWTSEGEKQRGLSPFIREMKWDGSFIRELPLLPIFKMQPAGNTLKGPRDNLTFEGLSLSPNGQRLWVSMEGPLYEDGAPASIPAAAGSSRFTEMEVATGRVLRQIAYAADAIPKAPIPATAFADNGIPEILMLDEDRMLVLERAYSAGVGNTLRLFEIDTRGAENVLNIPALASTAMKPIGKRLVLDFDTLGLPRLDNTEGMTWGKTLPNGNRTLVFVSDDNFNARQITQFIVVELKP